MGRQWLWRVAAVGTALVVALGFSGEPAFAALGGRVHPVRTPNGHAAHNLRNQVETANWSGYAVAHFETGKIYTEASATWIVPTVSDAPGFTDSYSSSWVGIGGFCEDAQCRKVDRTLIQLGTEQDASVNGTTAYDAWYEMLPAGPVAIPVTIHPGDRVTASLADAPTSGTITHGKPSGPGGPGGKPSGPAGPGSKPRGGPGGKVTGQHWVLTFTDATTGQSWTGTFTYNSSLLSAEWIEEAPYAGGILPLADFGTATFDPGSANGTNPMLSTQEGIVMIDPNGQTSNVSMPDSDTDGFNACWGNGTALTSCAAPAS